MAAARGEKRPSETGGDGDAKKPRAKCKGGKSKGKGRGATSADTPPVDSGSGTAEAPVPENPEGDASTVDKEGAEGAEGEKSGDNSKKPRAGANPQVLLNAWKEKD